MSRLVRLLIILISMIASYAVGWHLREARGLPKTGSALILLGVIIYGAGIFLVAQMYNIRANWPDGFILWMFGAVAMAYAARMPGLLWGALLLSFLSLATHPMFIFDAFRFDPFLLTSWLLLLLAAAVTLAVAVCMRRTLPRRIREKY